MALRALDALVGNGKLLYVGEWDRAAGVLAQLSARTVHGHTGGARFQEAVLRAWELVEAVPLPRWPGFADQLYVFQRRGAQSAPAPPDAGAAQKAASASGDASATAPEPSPRPDFAGAAFRSRLRLLEQHGLQMALHPPPPTADGAAQSSRPERVIIPS